MITFQRSPIRGSSKSCYQVIKIPLNLPLLKGDFNYLALEKGGEGDFKKERFSKRIQQNSADYPPYSIEKLDRSSQIDLE